MHSSYMRQGRSDLYELLRVSRRANEERAATARPGARNKERKVAGLAHGACWKN